jgi:hypothetical protein
VIDPSVLDRYRRVCALLGSPEPGERAAALRRKEKMEQDYPGIHVAAFPSHQEPDMSTKPAFSVDDLLRTATSPEFAGAMKAAFEAMSARAAAQPSRGAHIERVAARFDVDTDYDEDDGEFSVLVTWSERTMDKVLDQVSVDEYAQLADAIAQDVRTELVKVFLAARGAFSG